MEALRVDRDKENMPPATPMQRGNTIVATPGMGKSLRTGKGVLTAKRKSPVTATPTTASQMGPDGTGSTARKRIPSIFAKKGEPGARDARLPADAPRPARRLAGPRTELGPAKRVDPNAIVEEADDDDFLPVKPKAESSAAQSRSQSVEPLRLALSEAHLDSLAHAASPSHKVASPPLQLNVQPVPPQPAPVAQQRPVSHTPVPAAVPAPAALPAPTPAPAPAPARAASIAQSRAAPPSVIHSVSSAHQGPAAPAAHAAPSLPRHGPVAAQHFSLPAPQPAAPAPAAAVATAAPPAQPVASPSSPTRRVVPPAALPESAAPAARAQAATPVAPISAALSQMVSPTARVSLPVTGAHTGDLSQQTERTQPQQITPTAPVAPPQAAAPAPAQQQAQAQQAQAPQPQPHHERQPSAKRSSTSAATGGSKEGRDMWTVGALGTRARAFTREPRSGERRAVPQAERPRQGRLINGP
jgi:hypothetical protein